MWYMIDLKKQVAHLLPPILRSQFLLSLLCVMIVPLRYLHGKFWSLKEGVDNRLNISGNVQYLEKALNDAFYLTNHQIYIETPEERERRAFMYFFHELQHAETMYTKTEGVPYYFVKKNESSVPVNFIVMVPTFLCTSTNKNEDKYHGKNYGIIASILSIYKPAGRTFSIELYDYE